jgi:hypothetical protein
MWQILHWYNKYRYLKAGTLYHKSSSANKPEIRIEISTFRRFESYHLNTLQPVHKIIKFSLGLYISNLVTIRVIKQINVSQLWGVGGTLKNSIASACASGYFPFNRVSSRTNVDEEWQMSDAHSDAGKAPGTYIQFTAIFVKRCSLLPATFLAIGHFRSEILWAYTIVRLTHGRTKRNNENSNIKQLQIRVLSSGT